MCNGVHVDVSDVLWSFVNRFLVLMPVGNSDTSIVFRIYVEELHVNIESRNSSSLFSVEEIPCRIIEGSEEFTDEWLYGDESTGAEYARMLAQGLNLELQDYSFRKPRRDALFQRIGQAVLFLDGQIHCALEPDKLAPDIFTLGTMVQDT